MHMENKYWKYTNETNLTKQSKQYYVRATTSWMRLIWLSNQNSIMQEQQLHAESNDFKRIDIMVPPDHQRAGKRKTKAVLTWKKRINFRFGFFCTIFWSAASSTWNSHQILYSEWMHSDIICKLDKMHFDIEFNWSNPKILANFLQVNSMIRGIRNT